MNVSKLTELGWKANAIHWQREYDILAARFAEAERGLDAARVDAQQYEQANEFLNKRINELYGRLAALEAAANVSDRGLLAKRCVDAEARLAEAEALLRECEPNLDEGMEGKAWRSLVRRINAFLNRGKKKDEHG